MNLARVWWIGLVLALGLALLARPATAPPAPDYTQFDRAPGAGHEQLHRPSGSATAWRGQRRELAIGQTISAGTTWQPDHATLNLPPALPAPESAPAP